MIVYLHAGTHKTGTTAIQSFLYRQRDLLAERGLYLPRSGMFGTPPECGNHNVAFELAGLTTDPDTGGLDALIAELRDVAPERACVTSENFYPLSARPERLRLLRDAADGIGAQIRPILYFRPQAMFLEALYAERVKHGMTAPFAAFLDEALDNGSVSHHGAVYDVEYDRAAAVFAEIFGREAMTVLAYRGSSEPERFIAEFLAVVLPGCEDLDLTKLGAWERYNISIGFRTVASTLVENRRVEGDETFEDVLDEMLGERRESPDELLKPHGRYWNEKFQPLAVDDIARLYARFGDGNRILRALYGADVPVCPPGRLFDEVRARR